MSRLEQRDLEILRTLVRLHFVTSAQINAAFFTSEKRGYRRIQMLAARDFVRRHTRGAPPGTAYGAWRLTSTGMGTVRNEFPSEPVPEALDERLAELTLVDLEHREALNRVYFELVGGDRPRADESSWQAVQLWVAAIRHRADQFTWQPDGTVALRFRDLGQDQRVVPDATIESRRRSVRVFLELDRSTKPLSRIAENIERYGRFIRGAYRNSYPDGLAPWVVYLARSDARHSNVARIARTHLEGVCEWHVTTHAAGARWLARLLLDESREGDVATASPDVTDSAADAPRLRTAAAELLRSTTNLLKNNARAFGAVGREHPERLARWKRDLRALYELVREGAHGE